MIVADLLGFLMTQPLDREIAYKLHSEQCLMELTDINLMQGCEARPDGWVQNARPDKPSRTFILFPGN